jgi:hypothetical protein
MKKLFGVSAVIAVIAMVAWTVSVAMAAPLANPGESANCSTAFGEWHFVHVQTSASSGVLTVKFVGESAFTVPSDDSPSKNLHYTFNHAGTLESASDSVTGGKLNLSHCPTTPPPPPPPPPSPPPPPAP